jgi:hypothetical protein
LVVVLDTTQASASNRFRLYINGVEVTAFSGTNITPSQNYDGALNSTVPHAYGRDEFGDNNYYSGYLTETYLIDGQALTPSSFGETNAQTGVWQPKAYSGSYGTNGFYLNFSDNSNTTAATLGKDYSGNGNNWTPNNFSVTAGAGNDSLVDSPTSYGTDTGVGGTVRGNYCTWNPLYPLSNITNGNLDFSIGTGQGPATSSIYVTSGKWYFEITPTAITGTSIGEISITDSKQNMAAGYRSTGTKDVDSFSTNAAYGATWTVGDNIGVAFDVDNKQVTFYKNGASQGAITYTGSSLTTNSMGVLADWRTSVTFAGTANFGQRPFAYTAPSGFKALCTQNLPTPTIGATTATQATQYFNPVLYTGNGYPTSGTQSITTVGFQPDWVWIKNRSAAASHTLTDAVRGVNSQLFSNLTAAQEANTDDVTAFTSTGFNLGSGTTGVYPNVNTNGATYVAWNWKANGAGSTNTAGSITSTVSANTTSGFSVVNWTGSTSSSAQTVGHGLGVTPSMVILKNRSTVDNWVVYHSSATTASQYLLLNTTAAVATSSGLWGAGMTSSVVGIQPNLVALSTSNNVIMYCFAPVAGYSAFGSYTGNGSADGPFVYCGFKPEYLLWKRTDSGTWAWYIHDLARSPYNATILDLVPNASSAEDTDPSYAIDLLSNGFKIRSTFGSRNGSGGTYIFMAFATNPFKYSLAQ